MKIKAIENFKQMEQRERRAYLGELLINNSLYIFLLAAIIFIQALNPRFLSLPSMINILSLSAANLPMALGVAGAIILAGTDLSGGRVVGLVACVAAALLQSSGYAAKMFPSLQTPPRIRRVSYRHRPRCADRLHQRLLHGNLSPAPVHRHTLHTADRLRRPLAIFDDRQQQRTVDLGT